MGAFEKIISTFKKIGNAYYESKQRKEKMDLLLKQYEELMQKHEQLEDQDIDFSRQILEVKNMNSQICEKLGALEDIKSDLTLVKGGLQKSLLFSLRELHHELVVRRKWCTPQEKIEFNETYSIYHALGENGVADNYYREVMALPEKKPGDEN